MSNETTTDSFNGDNTKLCSAIDALLSLDARGAIAPHGIGGHARTLLTVAAARLRGEAAQPDAAEAYRQAHDAGEAHGRKMAALEAAQGEQQAVAWQTRTVSVVTGEIVESWRGCSQKDFDKTGGAPYVWEDVLRIEFRALCECPQPVAGDAVRDWPHIANEWADMATSCVEGLRNIRDGICTVDEAMTNAVEMLAHCREVNDAAPMSAAPAAPDDAKLTNPWTGKPRDYRDVNSDPGAVLCVEPGAPLRAAAPAPVAGDAVAARTAKALLAARSQIGARRPDNDEDEAEWWDELTELAALAQDRASPAPVVPEGFLFHVRNVCRAAFDLCDPKPARTSEDDREHNGGLALSELVSIAESIDAMLAAAPQPAAQEVRNG